METIYSKIANGQVLGLWKIEFDRIATNRSKLLSLLTILLYPLTLIDYVNIADDNKTLFLLARTIPSVIIATNLLLWILLKYKSQITYYVVFFSLIVASAIRNNSTDNVNYMTALFMMFTFFAMTFYVKLNHAIIMAIGGLVVHATVYFLLYSEFILFSNSGFITMIGLSVVFIVALMSRYNIMKRNFITSYKLKEQNDEINQQKNRLHELVDKINQQKSAILMQRHDIEEKNQELQSTLNDLAKKSKNIMASMAYAKRIQSSILPKIKDVKNTFSDAFILFMPRDIVSGDFYHLIKRDSYTFFAVADCTGHGVPGALMSMIGVNFIQQIIVEKKKVMPADILITLHKSITILLKQEHSNNRDGMDIALITIDDRKNKLYFSGAKNPLVMIRDGKLLEYKGSKYSIGGKVDQITFDNTAIELDDSTMIYMFSDGYQDQFGGKNNVKLMSNRFRKILFKYHELPLEEQQQELNRIFFDWRSKSSAPQIDDVLVAGIRL